jgi:hypothetical protein
VTDGDLSEELFRKQCLKDLAPAVATYERVRQHRRQEERRRDCGYSASAGGPGGVWLFRSYYAWNDPEFSKALSGILHHYLETVVHVKLLMAMKESRTRITCDEINFEFPPGWNNHYVFEYARGQFLIKPRNLEFVPVKMQGMRLTALIVQDHAIPPVRFHDY